MNNVEISETLYEKVRALAESEGRSVRAVVAEALEDALSQLPAQSGLQADGTYGKGGLREEFQKNTIDDLVDATYIR
jgi:predicted nucleic acid-binding protein